VLFLSTQLNSFPIFTTGLCNGILS